MYLSFASPRMSKYVIVCSSYTLQSPLSPTVIPVSCNTSASLVCQSSGTLVDRCCNIKRKSKKCPSRNYSLCVSTSISRLSNPAGYQFCVHVRFWIIGKEFTSQTGSNTSPWTYNQWILRRRAIGGYNSWINFASTFENIYLIEWGIEGDVRLKIFFESSLWYASHSWLRHPQLTSIKVDMHS